MCYRKLPNASDASGAVQEGNGQNGSDTSRGMGHASGWRSHVFCIINKSVARWTWNKVLYRYNGTEHEKVKSKWKFIQEGKK